MKNQEHQVRRRLLRALQQKELRGIVYDSGNVDAPRLTRRELENCIIANWSAFVADVEKTINANMFLASSVE